MKLNLELDTTLPTGVLGLALAPDASVAYAACADGALYKVDLDTGDADAIGEKHTSFASGCVILPDGQTVITGGYDGMLRWHDVKTGRCLRRVAAHKFWSWQLALSPDGKFLATTTGQYIPGGWKYEPAPEEEPSVKVFDTGSGERIAAFAHVPPVMSCAFAPDNQHLAAGNLMGEVRIWDLQSKDAGSPVAKWTSPDFTSWGTIKSHHYNGGIYGLAFASDNKSILACGMGQMTDPMAGNGKMTWQRWDWRKGEKLGEIKEGQHGTGLMEAITWHPDGRHFIMAGRQAQGTWNAAIFDSSDGNLVESIDTAKRVTHARFTADGKWLVISGAVGQKRKDGKWPSWGRLQMYQVMA
jgi:WD40 repeat protein